MTCMKTIVFCAVLTLAACGGHHDTTSNGEAVVNDEASLPKPEAPAGSVTGMPDKPGPGQRGPPVPGMSPATVTASTDVLPADGGVVPDTVEPPPGNPGIAPDGVPTPAAEPTPQDAVVVVRNYYAAIAAHDYAGAWRLWSDAGHGSGQTPQQFADGFADTVDVAVRTDAPSPVGAAAGSRYVEIPVAIDATQRDGSQRRYAGTYTLRRAVVDGATADQRAWRIASAALHEIKP